MASQPQGPRVQLMQVRGMMKTGNYAACIPPLLAIVDALSKPSDIKEEERLHLKSFACGFLGECLLYAGKVKECLPPYQESLDLCNKRKDMDGILANLPNVHEAYRYLGMKDDAIKYAEKMAELFHTKAKVENKPSGSPAGRKAAMRAHIMKQGEPLNRVVIDAGDRKFELNGVTARDLLGPIGFSYERNRMMLRPATTYLEQGKACGKKGNFVGALELFRAAAAADPYAPDPVYEEALTLLVVKKFDEALEKLRKVEELAPGWYYCRADLAMAKMLQIGDMNHDTFMVLRELETVRDAAATEDQNTSVAEHAEKNKELLETSKLAIVRLMDGDLKVAAKRNDDAVEAYRYALDNAADDDVKSRALLRLARLTGPSSPLQQTHDNLPTRAELLDQVLKLTNSGNLIAVAMAHVMKTLDEAVANAVVVPPGTSQEDAMKAAQDQAKK